MFRSLSRWLSRDAYDSSDPEAGSDALPQDAPIPTIWLFGKTGSGKTSVIATVTGAEEAEIGNGFRPTTKRSQQYDFPSEETPLVHFLDTRGIGEAVVGHQRDSFSVDVEKVDQSPSDLADLVLVTARVCDHSLDELIDQLGRVRAQSKSRPIILALTALHDAYAGQPHPDDDSLATLDNLNDAINSERLPEPLRRSLAAQLDRFDGLCDRVVAVDLTKPEDGFDPHDLGADRLFHAILDHLPAAMRQTLATMDKVKDDLKASHTKSVDIVILTHATIAAGAAAVPLAWVDMPVVMATQTHMAHRIAKLHRQKLDRTAKAQLSAVLGGRVALRMLVRGVAKAIPVVGSAVNSAAAFAMTFAAGKVCHWYFGKIALGHVPSEEEIAKMYREQIANGREYWKRKRASDS
ncbi:GTP-binding DUF697 domain-containing protein [Rubripirellula amarantea]|nr:GTP-binding DUF697 domain-containing protein [Rubripirellula amarantea]